MTRRDRNDLCMQAKRFHGYCKREFDKVTKKWYCVGECKAPDSVKLVNGK